MLAINAEIEQRFLQTRDDVGLVHAIVRHAFLRAQIDPAPDTLAAAQAAFEGMAPLDRRRVLASYQHVA